MMETEKYRFYVLFHSHLSTMQKGIQAAHCVAEMLASTKLLKRHQKQYEMISQWADTDKTLIVLDGGNSDQLFQFADFLGLTKCKFPRALFYEDQETMCGLLTAVGIIIPDSYMDNEQQDYLEGKDPDMLYSAIRSRRLAH
jgi:hypothetical protein